MSMTPASQIDLMMKPVSPVKESAAPAQRPAPSHPVMKGVAAAFTAVALCVAAGAAISYLHATAPETTVFNNTRPGTFTPGGVPLVTLPSSSATAAAQSNAAGLPGKVAQTPGAQTFGTQIDGSRGSATTAAATQPVGSGPNGVPPGITVVPNGVTGQISRSDNVVGNAQVVLPAAASAGDAIAMSAALQSGNGPRTVAPSLGWSPVARVKAGSLAPARAVLEPRPGESRGAPRPIITQAPREPGTQASGSTTGMQAHGPAGADASPADTTHASSPVALSSSAGGLTQARLDRAALHESGTAPTSLAQAQSLGCSGSSAIGRFFCNERVRWDYCKGRWNHDPDCVGTAPTHAP